MICMRVAEENAETAAKSPLRRAFCIFRHRSSGALFWGNPSQMLLEQHTYADMILFEMKPEIGRGRYQIEENQM